MREVSSRCHLVYALAPGGAVVLDTRDEAEEARLADRQLSVHRLTFSLSSVGFSAQTRFTLEQYRGVSLEELAAEEPDDPRYWWRRSA
jgi:hypothetical protein